MTLFLSFKEALPKGEACPHDFHFHSRRSALAPCPVAPCTLSSHPHLPPRRGDHRLLLLLLFFFADGCSPASGQKRDRCHERFGPSFNCALNYADAPSSPLSDGPRPRSTSLFRESGCDEAPLRRRLPRRGREETRKKWGKKKYAFASSQRQTLTFLNFNYPK